MSPEDVIMEQRYEEAVAKAKKQLDDDFYNEVDSVLLEIGEMLLEKNKKYGNSALEPLRVFSKSSPSEQILVRIDDKLSRLKTQHISEDEDVLTDLIGYLILLKIANKKEEDKR